MKKTCLEIVYPPTSHDNPIYALKQKNDPTKYTLPVFVRVRRGPVSKPIVTPYVIPLVYLINSHAPDPATGLATVPPISGTLVKKMGSLYLYQVSGIPQAVSADQTADYSLVVAEQDPQIANKASVVVSVTIVTAPPPASANAPPATGKRRARVLDGAGTIVVSYPTSGSTVCTQFTACGTYGGDVTTLSAQMVNGGTTIQGGPSSGDNTTGLWMISFINVPEESDYTLNVTDGVNTNSQNNITVDASVCNPNQGGDGAVAPPPPPG